jgi:hypothetical protein
MVGEKINKPMEAIAVQNKNDNAIPLIEQLRQHLDSRKGTDPRTGIQIKYGIKNNIKVVITL